MSVLGVSALDVILVVGLGAAGFVVVTLVCALVLAVLHLVLPATDSGAADLDSRVSPAGEPTADDAHPSDTGSNA